MKKKVCLFFLPIVTLFAFPSCSKQCTLTLNTGAGIFDNEEIHLEMKVNPGTKLSELKFPTPTSFFAESAALGGTVTYPVGWATSNGQLVSDYIINGNTTLEAHYFTSQESAINTTINVLNLSFQDALTAVEEHPEYYQNVIDAYDEMIEAVNSTTNEYQIFAIMQSGQADFGSLKRAILNTKPASVENLSKCRDLFLPVCLQSSNQNAASLGKTFSALYDAIGEVFNFNDENQIAWLSHFFSRLKNTCLDARTCCYAGIGTFAQGAVGAAKRLLMAAKPSEYLITLNNLYDLFYDGLLECTTYGQARAIGKFGAALADASGETYPNGYDAYYMLAKKMIDEVLNNGGNV